MLTLIIVMLLILGGLWAFGPGIWCYFKITRQAGKKTFSSLPGDFGYAYSDLKIKGENGVELACWYIPSRSKKGVLIASHNLGGNKSSAFTYLRPYVEEGYSLLMYDFRGHGGSDKAACTLGYLETKDLLIITDYVKSQLAEGSPIFYWGFSLGATVSLLAAARGGCVKAIIAHSPFVSLGQVLRHYAKAFYHVPSRTSTFITLYLMKRFQGVLAEEVDVGRAARHLADMPILLIGGARDRQVPEEWLMRLAALLPKAELLFGPYGHWELPFTEVYNVSSRPDIERGIAFLKEHTC